MSRSVMLMAALLLPLGSAVAGEWVVGGSVGMAQGDTDAGALNSQLAAQGLDATASSTDDSRTAWHLYLGFNYTPKWGVEFGYADLGEASTTLNGTTTDINTFLTSASEIHPQTAQGWQMSGIYRHPLRESLAATARLGLFVWESDYTLSITTVSRDVSSHGVSGVFGVGMEYEVYRDTYLHADYDLYDIDGENISLLSAGISYRLE